MHERRRYKRLPIKLQLEINTLFKQGHHILDDVNAEIEVINISKTGIGFLTKYELPIDYYFNAKIELPGNEFFYTVIKIIRKEMHNEGYLFGCEFVGLAEFLASKVDAYEDRIQIR